MKTYINLFSSEAIEKQILQNSCIFYVIRMSRCSINSAYVFINTHTFSLIDVCATLKAPCRINNRVRLPSRVSSSGEKRERSRHYNLLIGVLTVSRLKIICDRWRVRLLTNTFSQVRRALSSSWHTCSNTSGTHK
jgi:hypothetical protein